MKEKPVPNYFYVNRELLSSDRWFLEPFTRAQAWIDMIGLARVSDGYVLIRGIKIKLKRGQLAYSQLTLSKRWKWSRGKVRRFLKELENDENIVQQAVQRGMCLTTLITVKNYNKWQGGSTGHRTPNGHQTVHQTDTKRYTNKNDTNEKNENNDEEGHQKKFKTMKELNDAIDSLPF